MFPAASGEDWSRAQIAIFVLMITVGGGQLCDGCSSFDAGYPAEYEEQVMSICSKCIAGIGVGRMVAMPLLVLGPGGAPPRTIERTRGDR